MGLLNKKHRLEIMSIIFQFHFDIIKDTLVKLKTIESDDDKRLERIYQEAIQESEELNNDIGELMGEKGYELHLCHNNLYASLIVTIYAQTEFTLKKILSSVNSNTPNYKAPYNFKDIKNAFQKLNINLESLPEYAFVDACRILNNSFKHNNGKYVPSNNHPLIEQDIITSWNFLSHNNEINYTALPFKEILSQVEDFLKVVFSEIQNHLSKKDIE